MNKTPLVSIILPCYNVEMYVKDALESLLNQTYQNIEVIAIDDASIDQTLNIISKIAEKDTRVKVYSNDQNLKLIDTLNKAVTLCNGEYIARMDADDISFNNRIEEQLFFLEKNGDHDVVSTQFYTFKSGSSRKNLYHNPENNEDLKAYLLFRSGICHPAVMMRKTLFTEKKLLFEKEYLHVEDYALWVKASYVTKLANLSKPLLYYRIHESQISSLNEKRQIENKKNVFKIHCERWNLPQTKDFISVYASVAECVPEEYSISYLDRCEEFMLTVLKKNQEVQYCSDCYLQELLSLHWIRLCANSTLGMKAIKKCKESQFYIKSNYSHKDILFLYIKSLLRIEYKKSILYSLLFR